jgi:hypothetical protein
VACGYEAEEMAWVWENNEGKDLVKRDVEKADEGWNRKCYREKCLN